jgi:hypothetical protein
MDLLTIYYYTSVPILTCNMIFYSITALSTSITSSQNVVRFISEHKDCDSIVFKNELESIDLENKLKIIEALIFDIIKRHCNSNDEFEEIKKNINTPIITCDKQDDSKEFEMIELTSRINILERIDEPVRYAILSTSEIVQTINEIIIKIHEKIMKHNKTYLNKIVTLCLQSELHEFKKKVNLLDIRLKLLLDLLQIYLPKSH